MSPRPQRRRSSLSGESPIAPAPATEPAPAAEPAPVSPPASAAPVAPVDASPSLGTPGQGKGYATSATTVPAPDASDVEAAAPSKPASKYPPKVSFYQDRADTDRIRGAIMHTIPWEGTRTLSQFLSGAAMKEVERLEAQYNNGQPFPKVGARELPQGRPMGE